MPGGNVEAVMRMHEGEFRSKGDEAVPTASRQSEPTATSSPQTAADRRVQGFIRLRQEDRMVRKQETPESFDSGVSKSGGCLLSHLV